ncbi:MAG TPA: hypothetical protein VGB30_00870 [bacterium]|jgi:hypothetical protein
MKNHKGKDPKPYTRKFAVGQCYTISIPDFKQYGAFDFEKSTGYQKHIVPYMADKVPFEVEFELSIPSVENASVTFRYVPPSLNEKSEIELMVPLITTPAYFGNVRWWFACPLIKNGEKCGRRIEKLYLQPGEEYFGCRHCHDLTYRSSQRYVNTVETVFRTFEGLRKSSPRKEV